MANNSALNTFGGMRLDVPHIQAIISFLRHDFRALMRMMTGVERPYVVEGMEVIGKSGLAATIRVKNCFLINYLDENGPFYIGGKDEDDIVITLPASQNTIYVEARFIRKTINPLNQKAWNNLAITEISDAGREISQTVDFQDVICLEVTANTSEFSENSIRLFTASTDSSTITSFQDARDSYGRLGRGDNPLHKFPWSPNVREPVASGAGVGNEQDSPFRSEDASGIINDKGFKSFKDELDGLKTVVALLAGTPIWYDIFNTAPVTTLSLNQLFFDTLGHSIEPSKNSAFKWINDGGDLKLVGEGSETANGVTGYFDNGLIKWKANYHQLEWHLGGDFQNDTPGGTRSYAANGLRFTSPAIPDGSNCYLLLERERPKGSGDPVLWRNNSAYSAFPISRTVSGEIGDFTGIAIGDFIRKSSQGYAQYSRVVKMSDGTNEFTAATTPNRVADNPIIALELEDDIDTASEEELLFFRSRYSSIDVLTNPIPYTYTSRDSAFYWLGRRKGDLFILKDYGTMQVGEEATTLDAVFAHGKGGSGGGSPLTLDHAREAAFDATNGYYLKQGVGNLITIRKLRRDNTVEADVIGSDNSSALLEYTIEAPVAGLSVGQNLWVRLSDTTGGALTAAAVTNSTDDLDNTDVNTNRYEVLDAAGTPADTFDNINVHLLARCVSIGGRPTLVFADGSVMEDWGTSDPVNHSFAARLRAEDYEPTGILFLDHSTSKEVQTDISDFFYNNDTNVFGIGNFRHNANSIDVAVSDDISLFESVVDNTITWGSPASTTVFNGETIFIGTTTVQNVQNVITTDKVITLGAKNALNGGFNSGIEVADDSKAPDSIATTNASGDVTITYATPHGYTVGDDVGVVTDFAANGLTAGQLSGVYPVVAPASAAVGQAEVVSPTELLIKTSGNANATGSVNTDLPVTYTPEWSFKVGGSDGSLTGITSWVFRVKGVDPVALNPVNGYRTAPTANSATIAATRIPYTGTDAAGIGGTASTLDFSANMTFNPNIDEFRVVGLIDIEGAIVTDTPTTSTLGTPAQRFGKIWLDTGIGQGINFGACNLYDDAGVLTSECPFKTDQHFITDVSSHFKWQVGILNPPPPPLDYTAVFARGGLIFQKNPDGTEALLTNTESNQYEETVLITNTPSGNNQSAPIAAGTNVTIPKDTAYLLGSGLRATTTVGSSIITIKAVDHGVIVGDPIKITTTVPVGGIPALDLSGNYVVATVVNSDEITVDVGTAATTAETGVLDLTHTVKARGYLVNNNELMIRTNQGVLLKGIDWEEVGNEYTVSTTVKFLVDIDLDWHLTYDMRKNGGQVVISQGSGTGLQAQYLAGSTITVGTGSPVVVNGPANEDLLVVGGNADFDGIVCVDAIKFEGGANPLDTADSGLFMDGTSNLFYQKSVGGVPTVFNLSTIMENQYTVPTIEMTSSAAVALNRGDVIYSDGGDMDKITAIGGSANHEKMKRIIGVLETATVNPGDAGQVRDSGRYLNAKALFNNGAVGTDPVAGDLVYVNHNGFMISSSQILHVTAGATDTPAPGVAGFSAGDKITILGVMAKNLADGNKLDIVLRIESFNGGVI